MSSTSRTSSPCRAMCPRRGPSDSGQVDAARSSAPRYVQRVDPEAYEAYLLGRAYSYKEWQGQGQVGRGPRNILRKRLRKIPATLRPMRVWRYSTCKQRVFVERRSGTPSGPAVGRKALRLDDTLAEAHTALARVTQQEWDWAGAEREYRRAIELNPSYPLAHIWFAQYLSAMQRSEEAVTPSQTRPATGAGVARSQHLGRSGLLLRRPR